MSKFVKEIIDRRVLQAVGVYVGGSWVLVEIFDNVIDRYLLSPHWSELVFWGLYSLLPAVALIAWTHGKPGRDKATRTEIVGVPVNLIASLGLMVNIAAGKDFSPVADKTEIANEFGVSETYYVPKDNSRQRLAMFFWKNETGDPDYDWLQYGMAHLLVQDLSQNPFLLVNSPYAGGANGYYGRMQRAGFTDGLNLPTSLMREIAEHSNRKYFIDGSINREQDAYQLTARIYATDSMRLVTEITESGWDLLNLADNLSVKIRDSLEIPEGGGRLAEDLPLAETFGESGQALKLFTQALNIRLFENDFDAANEQLDQVLELDNGHVMAMMQKGLNLLEQGAVPQSQTMFKEAQKLDFKLPSTDQAMLKFMIYRFDGETERALALLKMQVEIRDDARSYKRLATVQMFTGQQDAAKLSFENALERDPADLGAVSQLAVLERASGNLDKAIEYATHLVDQKPEDSSVLLLLGDMQRDSGDVDAAFDTYQRSVLAESGEVTGLLRLVDLASRQGNWRESEKYLAEAGATASTAKQHAAVLQGKGDDLLRRGQIREALDTLRLEQEYDVTFMTPMDVAFAVYGRFIAYHGAIDQLEEAKQAFRVIDETLQPPLNGLAQIFRGMIEIREGRLDEAEIAIEQTQQVIEQFQIRHLQFQVHYARGLLAIVGQDYAIAAAEFNRSVELIRESPLGGAVLKILPKMYAGVARAETKHGNFPAATEALKLGFQMDEAEPTLWVEKARLQLAQGQNELADASIRYAMAIWKNADPDYDELLKAKELVADINSAL